MRRISISELSTSRWSLYQDVERYAEFGFSSLGIWRQKFSDFDRSEAIDFLYERKFDISCVHWAGGFTGSNGVSHRDAIEDAIEAIELAGQLNSPHLIVHSGSRAGHTRSHSHRLMATAINELVPVADDYGVKLLLEPIPHQLGRNWTIFDSLESTLEFMRGWSSEQVGIVLDLYYFGFNEHVLDQLSQFIDRVAHVQLADRTAHHSNRELRRPLGDGNIQISKWLQRLQELGYDGNFELEIHGEGVRHQSYEELLFATKRFVESEIVQGLLTVPAKKPISKTNQIQHEQSKNR